MAHAIVNLSFDRSRLACVGFTFSIGYRECPLNGDHDPILKSDRRTISLTDEQYEETDELHHTAAMNAVNGMKAVFAIFLTLELSNYHYRKPKV